MPPVLKNIRRTIINKEVIEDLQNSGLTVQNALDQGWFEGHSAQELKALGFQTSINKADIIQSTRARLVIPYLNENRKPIFYRLRLYPPISGAKYLQQIGISSEPYILPSIWALKQKNTKPLIIVEGEKKSLCLFKNGFSPIGLPGVWSWAKDGKLNQTLEQWNWTGRTVCLCFDNDRNTNAQILQAEISLGINLALRGAKVHIIEIPKSHKKMGVDDFIMKFSVEDFEELVNSAKAIYEAYTKDLENEIRKALVKATENQRFHIERIETVVEAFAEHFGWKRTKTKELLKKLIKREKEPTLLQQSAEIIYRMIDSFFADEQDNIYAILKDKRYYPIRSTEFKRIAYDNIIQTLQTTVSPQTVKDALANIEAIAHSKAEKRELFVRVGEYNGNLYYSLGNFKAVKIYKGGWEIVNEPPIFRHFPHQRNQTMPDENADVEDIMHLFDFINLPENDDKILLLTYLISAFLPNIPHPILLLYGEQGSGKSTLQRLLLELIDPSGADLLTLKGFDDLHTSIIQHHFLPFDNLNYVSQQVSDEFCRISTGGGFSKRKLYTDSEEVFFSYKRVLCLNGINLVATSPDLLDRAIILKLNRIPLNQRKTESELKQAINQAKPKLLGSIFTILSKIWKQAEKPPYPLPRMADFSVFAFHIAELLGYSGLQFLKAYSDNQKAGTLELVQSEPLANIIIHYFEDNNHYQGTPQRFLNELKNVAQKIGFNDVDLPKNSTWLMRKINTLKTSLSELGISYEIEHRGNEKILRMYKNKNIKQEKIDDEDMPF